MGSLPRERVENHSYFHTNNNRPSRNTKVEDLSALVGIAATFNALFGVFLGDIVGALATLPGRGIPG